MVTARQLTTGVVALGLASVAVAFMPSAPLSSRGKRSEFRTTACECSGGYCCSSSFERRRTDSLMLPAFAQEHAQGKQTHDRNGEFSVSDSILTLRNHIGLGEGPAGWFNGGLWKGSRE